MNETRRNAGWATPLGIVFAGLAMSVGWGFRGDYGHEAGAMVPGALLAMAICLASGREDWLRRAPIIGMCGAVGWAFGGQMSYGRIIGYTAGSSLLDVGYGYTCLFIIGGLWGGIGSAIMTTGLTQPRSYLKRFVAPLVVLWLVWFALGISGYADKYAERWSLHDTDWPAASSALLVAAACAVALPSSRSACLLIAVLASGWWAGYLLLVQVLGIHMTPPRSDNWAGCVGLFAALAWYLYRRRDRAALMMAAVGFLAGGVGFAVGDFVQMLGRAQWGPISRYEWLQGLDYWKWMEMLFGLIMGMGVAWVMLGRVRPALTAAEDDCRDRSTTTLAVVFLLVVMFWSNLFKNVRDWVRNEDVPGQLLGMEARLWLLLIGSMLAALLLLAVLKYRRGGLAVVPSNYLGRAQLLFYFVLWVAILAALLKAFPRIDDKGVFFVHVKFWIGGGLCSLIALFMPASRFREAGATTSAFDSSWKPRRKYWISLVLAAVSILMLAWLTVASHAKPLSGSHLRFDKASAEP